MLFYLILAFVVMGNLAFAEDSSVTPQDGDVCISVNIVLKTIYPAHLRRFTDQVKSGIVDYIPEETLLVADRWMIKNGIRYYRVQTVSLPRKKGWIKQEYVFPMSDYIQLYFLQQSLKRQYAERIARNDSVSGTDIFYEYARKEKDPVKYRELFDIQCIYLVNKMFDKNVADGSQKGQAELARLVKMYTQMRDTLSIESAQYKSMSSTLALLANQQNIKEHTIPDPYFARALWLKSICPIEALQDYFLGIQCILSNPAEDIANYRYIYDEISEASRLCQSSPIGMPGVSGGLTTAQNHFGYGYSAYWLGQYEKAQVHFTNAIYESGGEPVYWYYMGLTWKKLGSIDKAIYNVSYGAVMERYVYGRVSFSVSSALSRLQGEDRVWLETFRLGDSTGQILESLHNPKIAKKLGLK